VILDCGERAYIEEATRPTVSKTVAVPSVAAAPATSRISVDFTGKDLNTKMPAKPTSQTSSANRGSLVSGLVQLILLLVALAVAFVAGRNWERISGWVMGTPATATQSPTNAATTAETDAELAAARALFEERRYDKARDSFTALVKKDAANAEYHYWLGRTHYELKQPAEAIKQLSEATKLNDKLPNVFVHLALAYEAAGDKKNAMESLRRAITLPESPAPIPSATPAG
jgi:tetratricopeptide (TPR) repeat protein